MPELDVTPASRWRLALAESLAERYARLPAVVGMIVGGSTARGQADRFSDLELMVLWSHAPEEHERAGVVVAAGGDLHRLFPHNAADALWEDCYFMGRDTEDRVQSGCMVEVSHFLLSTLIDRVSRVLERAEADEGLLNLVAGVADGRILAGAPILRPLQERVAVYPDALQRAVVRRHGLIDHFWRWEMYGARGNNLPEAYGQFTGVIHQAAHLLLAVNRRYFGGWKWLASALGQCPLTPPDAMDRIRRAYQVPLPEGAQLVSDFVDVTFDLVERHVPGVDVARMRAVFHWRRPQWGDSPPPGLVHSTTAG